jgi:NADH-quinone oxidoreductase subunit K
VITLVHFLVVAALVLVAGIITAIAKRNALGILMGIELILSAAMINVAAFSAYLPVGPDGVGRVDGQVFTLFIMIIAAAQAVIAVAVLANLYQTTGTLDVEDAAGTLPSAPPGDG